MRRIIIFALALILASGAFFSQEARAGTAHPDTMANVCKNWLRYIVVKTGDWAGSTTPGINTALSHNIVHNDSLLGRAYAINPSGHVVVPAITDLPAVKSYSEEWELDANDTISYPRLIKDALLFWVRNLGYSSRAVQQQWVTFGVDSLEFEGILLTLDAPQTVGPLCSTCWHQHYPFNLLLDSPGQRYCDCGHQTALCAPTAAVQILKYYEWPIQGDSAWCFWCNPQHYVSLSHTYRWEMMQDTILFTACPETPPPEDTSVAELFYDIRAAGLYQTWQARLALPTYFGYSTAIDCVDHHDYPDPEDWYAVVKSEVDAGRPMQYNFLFWIAGQNSTVHSVVCDGAQAAQDVSQYHINYGWGGMDCDIPCQYTAWYAIDHIPNDTIPMEDYLIRHIMPAYPCSLAGELPDIVGPGICHVIDDIYVSSGQTVRILPATTFLFDGPYSFEISGTLLAEGVEDDSIVFAKGTSQWHGLRFLGSGSSACSLAYCIIEEVQATGDGYGGVYCLESSPAFNHCAIRRNCLSCLDCFFIGGGIACRSSSPRFTNCAIEGNSAYSGAGVYCSDNSSPEFTDCRIDNNMAGSQFGGRGGGIYCLDSSPSFMNCSIRHNRVWDYIVVGEGYGGGMFCHNSSPACTNCVISGNSAWGQSGCAGGGVYCSGNSSPGFVSCTISADSTAGNGGGIYSTDSSPVFNSTIISFSMGSGIHFENSSESQFHYCDFFNSVDFGGDIPEGLGLIDTVNANGDSCDVYFNVFLDPKFMGADTGDFHLLDFSQCIGAGDPDDPPPIDKDGNPRPNPPESNPDIGAYENSRAVPLWPLCGPLSGTLGPGIFHVGCTIYIPYGSTLELRPGTTFLFDGPYPFNINGTLLAEGTADSSIVFTIEPSMTDRRRGLRFLGPGSSGSRLAYCRIEKGRVIASDNDSVEFESGRMAMAISVPGGGGLFCYDSSPTFAHCTIENNAATGVWPFFARGGGALFRYSSAVLNSCEFIGNSAIFGGGVCCQESDSARFGHCIFYGNSADSLGGGVACFGVSTSPGFMSCDFDGNSATDYGGGLYCYQASPACTNCVLSANTAYKGGGVYCRDSSPPFVHCTFSGNTTSFHGMGGGAYCLNSSPTFNSSIIAFSEGKGIYFYREFNYKESSPGSVVKFCDFFDNGGDFEGSPPPGLGIITDTNANGDSCDAFFNIFLEPMFADAAFHLADSSHCIEAADPATGVTEDFEGDLRPSPPDTLPDIGADEHWSAYSVDSVTIQVEEGNAVLKWLHQEGWTSYMIYGSLEPFGVGTWLATVTGTTWTDEQTSVRPSPYFYYVTTGSRGSLIKRSDTLGRNREFFSPPLKRPRTAR